MSRTISDLQTITGLKAEHAKECFDCFGGYAPALASFAQSYASIPADYFENQQTAKTNAKKINDELRAIYRKARELKSKLGQKDADVWKGYERTEVAEASPAAPAAPAAKQPAAPAPAQFGFSANFAPAPTASSGSVFPAPAPAATGAISFGFGQPTPTTSTTQSGASTTAAFAAFGQPAPAPAAPAAEAAKKPLVYCDAKHFVGPYLDMPTFWEEEVIGRASLLNLNNGYLEAHKDELRPMMEKWLSKASFYRKPIKYVAIEDEDEEVVRVIIKDADRTFFGTDHRHKLVVFLHAMYHEFNAYGQAMSYLAGLCMLALTEEETASIIRFVSTSYIKGHWAAEAVGFATSAWVVEFFMQKLFPDVAKHLEELKFWPDTYLQKILTGLCIHVLQFNELFDFLNAFMEGGLQYLIRFCLAVVEHFRADILAIKTSVEANHLYEIMRLDKGVADISDIRDILARAPAIDLGDDASNIDLIRSQVYELKVAPRLSRAPKTNTFEPCVECEKNAPKWWEEDIGAICDACKEKHPGVEFEKY